MSSRAVYRWKRVSRRQLLVAAGLSALGSVLCPGERCLDDLGHGFRGCRSNGVGFQVALDVTGYDAFAQRITQHTFNLSEIVSLGLDPNVAAYLSYDRFPDHRRWAV